MESVLTVRIDSATKDAASKVLNRQGCTVSQAVRQLLDYVVENESLPFPSISTRDANDVANRIAAFDAICVAGLDHLSDAEVRTMLREERYAEKG